MTRTMARPLSTTKLEDTGITRELLDKPWNKKHKRERTEEVGEASSIKSLPKLKKPKPNALEEEHEHVQQNPKADQKKKNKQKEKVKNAGREMKEEKDGLLPGQIHGTPDERDPFRIFLETLHQQLPEDESAALWMMEWGLLPFDEAKRVHDKMLKKNLIGKLESAEGDVLNERTTFSERNPDFVSKTVSKTKKLKVRNNDSDYLISDLSARKKRKKHNVST